MYVDPSGEFAISAFMFTIGIGALIGGTIAGSFEIGKQIHAKGWNPGDWNWSQIGMSALGGFVAGAISAIPTGPGLLGYLFTFGLGGTASVFGGIISGSVTNIETMLISFAIGGVANVIGKGASDVIKKIRIDKQVSVISNKASRIASMSSKNRSLEIWNLIGTDNSTRNAFKSWGYNEVFSLLMTEGTNQLSLISTSRLTRFVIYSSIVSSSGSGWF